jgi:hypothetical protein
LKKTATESIIATAEKQIRQKMKSDLK